MRIETISDIVDEMRNCTAKSKDEAWYDAKKWAELCNRIEMAWEREAKAIATENAVLPAVCITKPVGNAAKMREALEWLFGFGYITSDGGFHMPDAKMARNKIEEALSAPPRNCDRYTSRVEAFAEWLLYNLSKKISSLRWVDFVDWLFAEAKGEIK